MSTELTMPAGGGPTVETPTRSVLWLTSRSAFERGSQFCPFARYVEYHAGPFGYGFQRKAQSVPLVTGTYAHLAPTDIMQWILDARISTGVQPDHAPDEVIRWAIQNALTKYYKIIEKRGILTLTQDDPATQGRLQLIIQEQAFLIEGLTWAWCLTRLPLYLQEYTILEVEGEQSYVRDCTCGLGDGLGEIADHEARGCAGIGLQSRPDILGERKSDRAIGYTEFKTTSVAKRKWADSWERKQQFLIGILGAERKFGVEVTHAWVEGLVKGQRKEPYPYDGQKPKQQQSCLVYGYFKPGIPPTSEATWKPQYNYFDREGIQHTAGKKEGYRQIPLWEHPAEIAWPGLPDGMSISEYWVKLMIEEHPIHVQKCLHTIGPIPKQRHQIDKALRSLSAEETLWQDRLWKIYEFAQANGVEWGNDRFHQFVETIIPRSWNCDPFGPDHPCPHQPICHPITDDWRDPVGSGLFVYRAPHHLLEKEQMIARGLEPEEGLGEDPEELEDED